MSVFLFFPFVPFSFLFFFFPHLRSISPSTHPPPPHWLQKAMEDFRKYISFTDTTLQGKPSSELQDPNSGIVLQDLLSTASFKQPLPTNPIVTLGLSLFPSTPPTLSLNSAQQSHNQNEKPMPESTVDFKHYRLKRLIRNRESASRSRARKKAHIEALELEVSHLRKENAKLRKELQQSQGCSGTSAQLRPKRTTLQRTSTAPF